MSDEPPQAESDDSLPKDLHRTSKAPRRIERLLTGIPAAPGIVIGTAVIVARESVLEKPAPVANELRTAEAERYRRALAACDKELSSIIDAAPPDTPAIAQILDAQLLILNDHSVKQAICAGIEEGLTAEAAVIQAYNAQEAALQMAKDEILRERAVDLENVKQRLLSFLRHKKLSHDLPSNSILISISLTPSQIMLFHEAGMLGFVTELSGIASHTSIMARSLHLPSVIGVKNMFKSIRTGDPIIVDGYAGVVIVHPRPETLAKYQRRILNLETKRKKLSKFAKLPSETSDQRRVSLYANADSLEEIDDALARRADGIGLVRTESLIFRLGRIPSVSEQRKWYIKLAERAYPLPITIRAFDIGGDKSLSYHQQEPNPALGLRGLRFLLNRRKLFRDQIKAVLRASRHRNVRFMLPMVTNVGEFRRALDMIAKCKQTLARTESPFDEAMPVGAMIETPAAALMAGELAHFADFFSIGTNDLTQYTLAADRANALVTEIFDSFNPAVLRLIQNIVQAGSAAGIPVGVCGEFAAHAASTTLLVGLGVNDFSVTPPMLLEVKRRIRKTIFSHAAGIAEEVLHFVDGRDVRKRVKAVRTKKDRLDTANGSNKAERVTGSADARVPALPQGAELRALSDQS